MTLSPSSCAGAFAALSLLVGPAEAVPDDAGTTRVSVDSNGVQGNGDSGPAIAHSVAMSPDGRWIAFVSSASNLVVGDTNGVQDVFLHDCDNGTTIRCSLGPLGEQSASNCYDPWVSDDGRYVSFTCDGDELSSIDTNGWRDVFVRDTIAGGTEIISFAPTGISGNGNSESTTLSADGRWVVFWSAASDLISGDTNSDGDIFLHDRQAKVTRRVSIGSNGQQGNDLSRTAMLSADGTKIVFQSLATNLVTGDTNGVPDLFVRDQLTGTTTRISNGGVGYNDWSRNPSISEDGRYIAFSSDATDIVPSDGNGARDVFLHDRQLGTTVLVSVDSFGGQGDDDSDCPRISRNGVWVTFESDATNLVPDDTNGWMDVFLRQTVVGWTERSSLRNNGKQAPGISFYPVVSENGRYVGFGSSAGNLVPGDTNGSRDVFRRDRAVAGAEIGQVYCTSNANSTGVAGALSATGSPVIAHDQLFLRASSLPSGEFGYFLISDTQGFIPLFAGSQGNLCLGGQIVRFAQNILQVSGAGEVLFQPALGNLPQNTVLATGESWSFQLWFRDGHESNTSGAVCVAFL